MERIGRVVLIDDDLINNFIITTNIKLFAPQLEVKEFTNPVKGLEFLTVYSSGTFDTLVFLDLNMPFMSGWDLLRKFSQFTSRFKSRFRIYVLSSSADANDMETANAHPEIIKYLVKPLTLAEIKNLLLL